MKLAIAALLTALAPAAFGAGVNPATAKWHDFVTSDDPADRKVVKYIQTTTEWWRLCLAWGKEAKARKDLRRMYALQAYLKAESFINGKDEGAVREREPEIGMTFCGVLAAVGMPDRVNQTERANAHRNQMVYRARRLYVYTEGRDANGTVVSIQR